VSTVRELMTSDVLAVDPSDTIGETAQKMVERGVSSAVVSDYGTLIGIVTERDLTRAVAGRVHSSEARVREWMTAEPVAVPASAPIELAVGLMNEYGVHHLPVVEGERPVGMLGYRQALRVAHGRGVGLGF
jgi:CBS domain-containing protein